MICYQKILLPLDGSELAERALRPAAQIAAAMSAELTLLRVVLPPPVIDSVDIDDQLITAYEKEATTYLDGVKARLMPKTMVVKTAVFTTTSPAKTIIHFARDNEIDLIVMSSHGRSGLKRWLLGSTAIRVLHKAQCNTLIIRAKVTHEIFAHNHFLVPLDGSKLAEQALAPAVALAQTFSAKVCLFSAIYSLVEEAPALYRHHLEQVEQEEYNIRKRYLNRVIADLSDWEIPMKAVLHTGPAHECILDYADEQMIDLIVISSHGRSGIALWAYGSVTEKILNGARCAVLVVKTPHPN